MKLFGALLGAATLVSPAYSNPNCRHPSTALADILVTEIRAHLGALQERARLYHDNRAFSTYGYEESVTYVLGVIGRFSAGRRLKTVVQSFDHLFEKSITKIKGPDDKDVMAMPLLYGNKTMGPGGIRRELAPTPIDDERGSCCFEDQWKGVNVRDKIALIKVGVCPMADKVQLATKNGARAVVLYNNVPVNISMGEVNKALGVDNWNKRVPAGLIGLEDGADWNQRLRSGEQLKVTLKVESEAKKKKSWNIITEVQEGDPEKIIMLGTHLDSSLNSPGINNGGSGTAALLSILRAVTRASCYKYRIRLAWWGAHEYGLAGSRHYASRLSKADAKKIKFYFNYDTIGSLDPHWTVLEDRGADKRGGTLLYDYLKAQGLDVTYKTFDDESDHMAFHNLGISSSGLTTSPRGFSDPCYRLPCDTILNVDEDVYRIATETAVLATLHLALGVEKAKSGMNESRSYNDTNGWNFSSAHMRRELLRRTNLERAKRALWDMPRCPDRCRAQTRHGRQSHVVFVDSASMTNAACVPGRDDYERNGG